MLQRLRGGVEALRDAERVGTGALFETIERSFAERASDPKWTTNEVDGATMTLDDIVEVARRLAENV